MTLLERYIFRRALISSVGSLVSLALIVWVVQALSRIDIVKTSASAAGNIFWIALMLLPDLAAGVLPFAILIGAIQTLNSLNADSERAVIAASGGSMSVIAKPMLLLGFIGGLVTLTVAHGIGPMASSAFFNGLRTVNIDTITVFLTPGRFERVRSDLVISVGDSSGGTIESLFIQDTRDPQLDLTYFAKEAAIVESDDETALLLYDGQLHRKDKQSGAVSVIEFQTYAFDLSELKPATESTWTRTSEQSTWELLKPNPNDPIFQNSPGRNIEELADRFSSWLYCLVFALWAITVAGHPQTNRQASNAAMAIGIAGAVGLKAIGFVVVSLVGDAPYLAFLPILVPILAILLNIALIRKGTNISQLSLIQTMIDVPGQIRDRLRRSRKAPYSTAGGGAAE